MRIAISNIAWDVSEDDSIAQLLIDQQIDAIDVAPSKYFPDLTQATTSDIQKVKHWWRERGIHITGMQALLFGTQGLNLFGDAHTQQTMLQHLTAVCRIGAELGASRLVFGSPKNRNRNGLTNQQAEEIALHFFHQLGQIAQIHGVTICLEPNPSQYGCNFMTTTEETAAVVRQLASSAIAMQLDTGAMNLNQENPGEVIKQHADIIGHIHLSEPHLLPLGDGNTAHQEIADALQQYQPQPLACIEMLATTTEPHINAIQRALQTTVHFYRTFDHKIA